MQNLLNSFHWNYLSSKISSLKVKEYSAEIVKIKGCKDI